MVRQAHDPMTLAEAARWSGLAHSTLRVLVFDGRLTAHKRAGVWWVYRRDVKAYLKSRHQGQRPKPKRRSARPQQGNQEDG